jgi:hypothetical protein
MEIEALIYELLQLQIQSAFMVLLRFSVSPHIHSSVLPKIGDEVTRKSKGAVPSHLR